MTGDTRTVGQRAADAITAALGSWRFILIQSGILGLWVALNATQLLFRAFDPYPFILMNLTLSMQAAFAAPIIMMSQNRQNARDRQVLDGVAQAQRTANQTLALVARLLAREDRQIGRIEDALGVDDPEVPDVPLD